VTASWDKTVAYWDPQRLNTSNNAACLLKVKLPDYIQCMDMNYPLLAVACAEREIFIFDIRKPNVYLKVCCIYANHVKQQRCNCLLFLLFIVL